MGATEYCLLGIDWWPVCMDKAQWAAWVQAVGAILAIIATGSIAYVQNLQQRRSFEKQAADERQKINDLRRQAEAAAARAIQEEFDARDLRYRRIVQLSTEVVAMLLRCAAHNAQRGRPRLDPNELSDLRTRLYTLEDAALPFEWQATINKLREIIGDATLRQHQWNMHSDAKSDLSELTKKAAAISQDAGAFLEAFRDREMPGFVRPAKP